MSNGKEVNYVFKSLLTCPNIDLSESVIRIGLVNNRLIFMDIIEFPGPRNIDLDFYKVWGEDKCFVVKGRNSHSFLLKIRLSYEFLFCEIKEEI